MYLNLFDVFINTRMQSLKFKNTTEQVSSTSQWKQPLDTVIKA